MSRHHRILGVSVNATLRQIKSAYFQKAKLLHPDVNKSPNAMEEFVKLNMAYEALTNPKYTHPPIFRQRKTSKRKSQKSNEEKRREWIRQRNEELRKKAAKAAQAKKMRKQNIQLNYYNNIVVPAMTTLVSILFLIPSGISIISNFHLDADKPNYAAVLIGSVVLALGIFLSVSAVLFLYKKLFK